jgi:glutaminase
MENFNENSINEMENLVQQFYDLTKTSSIDDSEKLKKFNNIDLEELMEENGSLEIDLKSLLGIDK